MVGYHEKYRRPKVTVSVDQTLMAALRLSKIWNCTPQMVLDSPCDHVVAALEYEKFHDEYEQVFVEKNREQ